MKVPLVFTLVLVTFLNPNAEAQTTDTLINVGNHALHFTITRGVGMPIIFESGAGNDGSVWSEVRERLSQRIDAPLITYDRAGFGTSEIDTNNINITSEVNDLQTGLNELTFNGDYFLVAPFVRGKLRHEI